MSSVRLLSSYASAKRFSGVPAVITDSLHARMPLSDSNIRNEQFYENSWRRFGSGQGATGQGPARGWFGGGGAPIKVDHRSRTIRHTRALLHSQSARPTHETGTWQWAVRWRDVAVSAGIALAGVSAGALAAAEAAPPGPASQHETIPDAPTPPSTVVEPITGVAYPRQLATVGAATSQRLAGCGVRLMTPLKVKAYTIGVYLDEAHTAAVLAPWRGKSADELKADPELLSQLAKDSVARSIRLVMVRDVDGGHLAKGFDRTLIHRLRYASKALGMPPGKPGLKAFNEAIRSRNFAEGTEMVITCARGGQLTCVVNGKPIASVGSPALCWAFFDMYCGQKPASVDVRDSVFASLAELLSH